MTQAPQSNENGAPKGAPTQLAAPEFQNPIDLSPAFAIVVPLEDGTYAIYASDFTEETQLIVDDPDDLAIGISSRAAISVRRTAIRYKREPVDLDFSDLGI